MRRNPAAPSHVCLQHLARFPAGDHSLDAWLRELTATISEAQRDGDVDPDADPCALASLLLAVLRGIEALRKGGASIATINAAAQQRISLLPMAAHRAS